MKLTTRNLRIITALAIIALAGLIVMQYLLLVNAYEYRQQAFERNVYAAMGTMVQKLETGEAAGSVFRIALAAPHLRTGLKLVTIDKDTLWRSAKPESLSLHLTSTTLLDASPLRIENGEIHYTVSQPEHVTLQVANLAGRSDTTLVDAFQQPGEYKVRVGDSTMFDGEVVVKYLADSNSVVMRAVNGDVRELTSGASVVKKRKEILGRAFDNLSFMEHEPISRRISPSLLDSVVDGTLEEAGIDIPYAYGLHAEKTDSLSVAKPAGFERELRTSPFRNHLFPSDLLFSQNSLVLFFPGQSVYLLKQMAPFLALSVLFSALILACFAYTIRTILRQKEFAVRLVDFINNMTHEFKTPISTIAVAVETIARPEVLDQREKILRYSAVIQDENNRMKKQVDKILQMAVLEEGDYELSVADVDLHDIVRKAVESITLQIESKEGMVTCDLGAARSVVRADAVHLANIVNSILDNANKYSPSKPVIAVSTFNANGEVVLEIADQGIGIAPEDQRRVFDKYFRVHTGNVHDVKGFGLGLSYVKLMTEAQGGKVSLESDSGKGTTVRLLFPSAGETAP